MGHPVFTHPKPFIGQCRFSFLFQVRKHFAPSVSANLQENPMWFEANGAPVRWHLPVGLLFDLAAAQDSGSAASSGASTTPWNVTVHFDKYPDKEILKCDSRSVRIFEISIEH